MRVRRKSTNGREKGKERDSDNMRIRKNMDTQQGGEGS